MRSDLQADKPPVLVERRVRREVLNECIGRYCRPVAEKRDIAGMRGDPGERVAKPVGDRLRRIGRGRGDLPNVYPAAAFVEQANIGECAAGIDADPPSHCCFRVLPIRGSSSRETGAGATRWGISPALGGAAPPARLWASGERRSMLSFILGSRSR